MAPNEVNNTPAPTPSETVSQPGSAAERAFSSEDNGTGSSEVDWSSIDRALNYDPFPGGKTPETNPSAGAQPAADGGSEATSQPVSTQPVQATPTDAGAQPAVESDAVRQLKADLAARDAIIQSIAQAGNPPQGAGNKTPEQPKVDPLDAVPEHIYQFPQQILDSIRSEDPAQFTQGVSMMAGMIMRTVHKAVVDQMNAKLTRLQSDVLPSAIRSYQNHHQQAKTVFEDFYNTHADLNKPALYPVIQGIAQQMLTKNPNQQWSPEFRDAVATAVRTQLGLPTPGAKPAVQQPVAQQPAMMGTAGGQRPVQKQNAASALQQDVMDTLFRS